MFDQAHGKACRTVEGEIAHDHRPRLQDLAEVALQGIAFVDGESAGSGVTKTGKGGAAPPVHLDGKDAACPGSQHGPRQAARTRTDLDDNGALKTTGTACDAVEHVFVKQKVLSQ